MTEQLLPSPERQLEKLCYNIEEVAEVLGICKTEASNLVHSENFPAFRLGRRVLISRERLREWVNKKADEGLGDRYIRKEPRTT